MNDPHAYETISGKRILRGVVIGLTVAAIMATCTGCETLRQPEEAAWQTMHAIDIAQTLKIKDSPCLEEGNPVTRFMIGRKPDAAAVAAWGFGSAYLHLFVSDMLRDRGATKAYKVWQFVSITDTGYSVGHNHALGIRIGKPNVGKAVCK